MKSYIVFLVVCLVGLCVIGCSSFKDMSNTYKSGAALNEIVITGKTATLIKSVNLTSADQAIVTHSLNSLQDFSQRWAHLSTVLELNTADYTNYLADYVAIKGQYEAIQDIVKKHWDEFAPEDQAALRDIQGKAALFDAGMVDLDKAGKRYLAIQHGLSVAKEVIKIAVALKP